MRIEQAYVALPHFREKFLSRYSLSEYSNKNKPAILFGCYNRPQVERILKHRSLAVIVWLGSDAFRLASNPKRVEALRNRPDTHHVAISNYISANLSAVGLAHRRIPLCVAQPKANPQPLGENVYCYLPRPERLKKQGQKYGYKLVRELESDFRGRIAFSYAWLGKCSQGELESVYKRAFIGLRLTPHDGLSNTVIELGLMGRRCVTNLDTPNAISWKTKEDVARAIEREYQQREQAELFCTPETIATLTARYIDVGSEWLNTQWWGNKSE